VSTEMKASYIARKNECEVHVSSTRLHKRTRSQT